MRGKRVGELASRSYQRNIPAYAGKTRVTGKTAFFMPEHPRVCGENEVKWADMTARSGTSPRMRGKQPPAAPWTIFTGNIPAYAGKTISGSLWHNRFEEHPRVCGENLLPTYPQ